MQKTKSVIDIYFTKKHFCEIHYLDEEEDAYVINIGRLDKPEEIEIGFFTIAEKAFDFYDKVCKTLGEKEEIEWKPITS